MTLQPKFALAQTKVGSVSGRATDPSDAAIQDAQVVLTNEDTGVDQKTTTTREGCHRFFGVHPGKCRVSASSTGFRTLIKEDLVLHVQEELVEDFQPGLGSVSDSITVDSSAPLVNTSDASVSTVVDRRFVENMPLNDRGFHWRSLKTAANLVSKIDEASSGPMR